MAPLPFALIVVAAVVKAAAKRLQQSPAIEGAESPSFVFNLASGVFMIIDMFEDEF